MNSKASSNPDRPDFLTDFRHWLHAFDDIVHHDPGDALVRNVEQLETRLARIEDANPGPSA